MDLILSGESLTMIRFNYTHLGCNSGYSKLNTKTKLAI